MIRRTVKRAKSGPTLSYDEFTTGFTYYDVYHMIYCTKWKRRHGVLGKWRELKQAMYAQYLNDLDGEG